MAHFKIGNAEFLPGEIIAAIDAGKTYLASYRSVYLLRATRNGGERGEFIHRKRGGLSITGKGRFFLMNGAELNRALDFNLANVQGGAE
jgi:hypothetical protein